MLTHGIPPDYCGGVHLFIYLNHHTPSGQPRVDRFTQLRTGGVHCRESAGTGPVVLKLVPVTSAAFAGRHGPINVRLPFPTSTIGMKWAYAATLSVLPTRVRGTFYEGFNVVYLLLLQSTWYILRRLQRGIFVVVVAVVFTLKAVPISTQYFLTSVRVQLTRTPSVVTG